MAIELTDRELDVMSILWETGGATVAEVRMRLGEGLAYTSVLSALQLLEHKGHIRHEKEGRAFRYIAVVEPEDAGKTMLSRMLAKLYQNSPVKLMAHLVSEGRASDEEIRSMRALLDECLEDGISEEDR